MQTDPPTAPADEEIYLPEHVYANWLLLAARIAKDAPDKGAWRRWAKERIQPNLPTASADSETPRAARQCRRVGYMSEAHW